MKKYLIAVIMLVLISIGVAPAANAAQWEPNGEEQVVTLTPPSALHGCARVVDDIQGLSDVYVDYNGTQELVASWSVTSEDPEFFFATATLQSQFYSLNNPLHPGRSTETTFPIEKCPVIEVPPATDVPNLPPSPDAPPAEEAPDGVFKPELTGSDPVVVPPVVPVVPVQQIEIPAVVDEKPVEAPVTPSSAPVAPSAEPVVEAVTEAPVAATEELAETGLNEFLVWFGVSLLALGAAFYVLAQKIKRD